MTLETNGAIGSIQLFAGSIAPLGYLICDGTAISRVSYASLFNVIGTQYGTGDGSTTFNIPDLRGRIATGYDSTQTEFNTLGKTGGEKTHILTVKEMPSHNHGYDAHWTEATGWNNGEVQMTDRGRNGTNYTNSTGGDQAHNNLQPYITLNYIIKY
jgi:Microcystin-dependent protein